MSKFLGKGSSIRTVAYGSKPSPNSLYAKVYGVKKPTKQGRARGSHD